MDYFFCYDSSLGKYLKSKGFKYITRAKHYRTEKEFSLFLVTEELKKLVEEYNLSRKSKN